MEIWSEVYYVLGIFHSAQILFLFAHMAQKQTEKLLKTICTQGENSRISKTFAQESLSWMRGGISRIDLHMHKKDPEIP